MREGGESVSCIKENRIYFPWLYGSVTHLVEQLGQILGAESWPGVRRPQWIQDTLHHLSVTVLLLRARKKPINNKLESSTISYIIFALK